MRCTNCGWNNPENLKFCQKCNEPLVVYEIHSTPLPSDIHQPEGCENKTDAEEESVVESALTCRKCGYPLLPDAESCPNCGAQIKASSSKNETSEMEAAPVADEYNDGRATQKFVKDVSEKVQKTAPAFANATVRDSFCGKDFKKEHKAALRETRRDASYIGIGKEPVATAPEHLNLHPIDATGIEGEAVTLSEKNNRLSQAIFSINNGKWEVNCESSQAVFMQIERAVAIESGDILIIDGKKYRIE